MKNLANLILITLLFFVGCNQYTEYYSDFTGGKNVLENENLIAPTEKPKLIAGYDQQRDDLNMLENSFVLLGTSSFNAGPVNQNLAIDQAKKIHADTVIIYNHYTHTVSGYAPMSVPNTQTSYHSGNVYGYGGSASYSGMTTTYGTSTTYVPYNIQRYDYFASYWVKGKPPKLGIIYDDLNDELREKIGSNKGIYVSVVIKNTPAFENDILKGDIIRKANGIEIIGKFHFQNWLFKTNPTKLELEILRNDKTITKQIELN